MKSQPAQPPKILIAAYHFPPSAAVGGLRVARFARLLPSFGWQPYVLSVREDDRDKDEGTDISRLAGLESVPILRTGAPAGAITLYGRIKSRLRGRARSSPGEQQSPNDRHDSPSRTGGETWVERFKRYTTSLAIRLPDEQKNWSLRAVLPAIRRIREHHIDWILTSGPPFSVHFIGLMARMFTSARWAADFRDPWIEMLPERPAHTRSWLSDRIERWMEGRVVHWADRVLTTTDQMRQSLSRRHPTVPAEKFVHLPNGVDVQLPPGANDIGKYDRLTITYAGTLYFDRTPEPLFRAFGELVREGAVKPSDFRIKLIGACHRIGQVDTLELARGYGVESAVEIIDRMPHAEAIAIMRRSHLLLVLAPRNHGLVLPAKIFDYMGSGSQILALAEPGATVDLVRETGAGVCFSDAQAADLKGYLRYLLDSGQYRDLRNEPAAFGRYDARLLTGMLVAELAGGVATGSSVPVRS